MLACSVPIYAQLSLPKDLYYYSDFNIEDNQYNSSIETGSENVHIHFHNPLSAEQSNRPLEGGHISFAFTEDGTEQSIDYKIVYKEKKIDKGSTLYFYDIISAGLYNILEIAYYKQPIYRNQKPYTVNIVLSKRVYGNRLKESAFLAQPDKQAYANLFFSGTRKFCDSHEIWTYIVTINNDDVIIKSFPGKNNNLYRDKSKANEIIKGKIVNGEIKTKNLSGVPGNRFKYEDGIFYEMNDEDGYNDYHLCQTLNPCSNCPKYHFNSQIQKDSF